MATTSAQIRDLLVPSLNAIFGEHPDFAPQWPEIFEKNTSDKAYERDIEIKLFSYAQQRSEGAATAMEDAGQRYAYTYRHIQVALGFTITEIAVQDNQYKNQFRPNAKALKRSIAQTLEVYGASVLNNSTDTTGTYYGGDGVPLFSVSHPIDTGTQANTFTIQTELNETSLQDAILGVRRFRDAAGLKKLVKPTKLVIPPDLMFVAERLRVTPSRVGTSDNDINALRSLSYLTSEPVINDFITNAKFWMLKTDAPDGLKYFERQPVRDDMFVDFQTDNIMTKASTRFSFGWSDWRAVFGCNP
jgi:hypothetical protein